MDEIKFLQNQQNTLFVGLGNYPKQYAATRHNTGFMFIEYLAKALSVAGHNYEITNSKLATTYSFKPLKTYLIKPQTYMNLSGKAVQTFIKYHSLDLQNLIVVYDDLDLKLGESKLQFGKSPKNHNGHSSVRDILGSNQFWNLRIGIDNREFKQPGQEYVLQKFTSEEMDQLPTLFTGIDQKYKILTRLIER